MTVKCSLEVSVVYLVSAGENSLCLFSTIERRLNGWVNDRMSMSSVRK